MKPASEPADIYHRWPQAVLGYGIDDSGEFLKICGCCPDKQDALDWAKARNIRTKIKPCVVHFAAKMEAMKL